MAPAACIALGLFTLPMASRATAPACEYVLSKTSMPVSKPEEALDNLAKLKLKVDFSLAQGNRSAAETSLNAKFKEKFQEFLRSFDGKISAAQLRELIAEKIQELQGLDKTATKQEQTAKRQLLDAMPFSKVESVEIDNTTFSSFQFTSENQKALYFKDSDSFSIFNLESNKLRSLTASDSIVLSRDRILYLNHGVAQVYDIATGAVDPYHVTGIQNPVISQSKKWVASHSDKELHIFNESTGENSAASFTLPKRSLWGLVKKKTPAIKEILFINDSEILILTEDNLYKFNFQTGQNIEIKNSSKDYDNYQGIVDIVASPNQDSVLFKDHRGKLFYLETKDFGDIENKARKLEDLSRAQIFQFKFTQDGQGVVLRIQNEIQSYDLKTQTPIKVFADELIEKDVPEVLPLQTADNRTAYVIRRRIARGTEITHPFVYVFEIEKWQRGGDTFTN
jgi:hypothetical protein